eukprot:scaffold82599_cov71-Phaeocystis_antarctica.AAC.1
MSVSDSSRCIRSRAQYAAKWCVVVTVEPPKGTEGITRHDEASLSQHMAAETGGWRRPSKRSVLGAENHHNVTKRNFDSPNITTSAYKTIFETIHCEEKPFYLRGAASISLGASGHQAQTL